MGSTANDNEGFFVIGNWIKMTTTTASGTAAVAGLTAVSGYPTVGDLFADNVGFDGTDAGGVGGN